jgi:hypothetical protein
MLLPSVLADQRTTKQRNFMDSSEHPVEPLLIGDVRKIDTDFDALIAAGRYHTLMSRYFENCCISTVVLPLGK